jgi:hypothetical protein
MERPAAGDRQSPSWLMSWSPEGWKVQLTPRNRSHYGGPEPAIISSVKSATRTIHLGMDTSKNTIVPGILMPGDKVPVIDRI